MGLLRLAVLGPPEVFHDGRRLTFSLRKALALLVYLAVEGGFHPRSKLAVFLWPDSEPHDALHNLRNAIALLRSLLADSDATPRIRASRKRFISVFRQRAMAMRTRLRPGGRARRSLSCTRDTPPASGPGRPSTGTDHSTGWMSLRRP